MHEFLATVNIGLEKIAAKEISEILSVRTETGIGNVRFKSDLDAIFKLNIFSRTIHKLIFVLGYASIESLQDIYNFARYLDYTNFIERHQSFAVRVERIGKHNFTSIEAASRIGQAIIDSFIEMTGCRLKVDLENPDIEVLARIVNDEISLGINTTGTSLHKRNYKRYNHPAGLSSTIASSMIYLSGWKNGEILLDPMCGGATIPIEAALMAKKIPLYIFRERGKLGYAFKNLRFLDLENYERLKERVRIDGEAFKIVASDISSKYLKGAMLNAKNALVYNTIDFCKSDARSLDKWIKEANKVVVNPPYGKRSADIGYVKELYQDFLVSLRKIEIDCAVLITAAPKILRDAAIKNGFQIVEEYSAIHGDLYTKVFKFIPA